MYYVVSNLTFKFPIFAKLCKDEIWGVRKACAESLVLVGKSMPTAERCNKLISVFEDLVDDVSITVSIVVICTGI